MVPYAQAYEHMGVELEVGLSTEMFQKVPRLRGRKTRRLEQARFY